MRICFIGHFTAGGTESATFLVANGLRTQHEVFIINTCNKMPTFYLETGIKIDYLPSGNILKRILYLVSYLKKKKIDTLITVESLTGVYSVPAVTITRCKHIVWEHANYFQSQGSHWIQKIRQIELLSANAYVVLTKRDRNNFIQHFTIKTRLEQIYNIANQQSKQLYDLNSKLIISVGHLRKIKNFIIIPDVAKIVFSNHPDWKWKIYGDTNGDEYQAIRDKIYKYNLQEHVLLAGRCNNMDVAYQQAAMCVLTSLQEGLPMVLLEAKANKLPLVSFNIETGPDEIINNKVNGFLIPSYNIEAMAEKICRLIEDKELRKNFSECSKYDLELFSKESILQKWNLLLKSI